MSIAFINCNWGDLFRFYVEYEMIANRDYTKQVIAEIFSQPVSLYLVLIVIRGSDPYGTGGTCPPNIYEVGEHPW